MADDVTDKAPLKGGRQRANHIQVHRIELGMWERKHIAEPLMKSAEVIQTAKTVEAVGKSAAYVVGAGALVGGVYIAWWTLDTMYNWMGNAKETIDAFLDSDSPLPTSPPGMPAPTLTQEQQERASSNEGIFFPFNKIPGLTWLP